MERSLVLIKPDAMKQRMCGIIFARIESRGLRVVALRMLHMDHMLAKRHYAVHEGKPFFNSLVEYITSAPIISAVFEGENAVEVIRKVIGATDPTKAETGTIRADFGTDIQNNCIHGSDSIENAKKEISVFFGKGELFEY